MPVNAKRTVAIAVAAVLFIALVLVFAARWYEGHLESQLEEGFSSLGFPAYVGKVEISLRHGAVTLNDVEARIPLDDGYVTVSVEKAHVKGVRVFSFGKRDAVHLADGVTANRVRISCSQSDAYANFFLKAVSFGEIMAAPGLLSGPDAASVVAGLHSITLRSGWFFGLSGNLHLPTGRSPRERSGSFSSPMPLVATPGTFPGARPSWENLLSMRVESFRQAFSGGVDCSVELLRFDSLSLAKAEQASMENIRMAVKGEDVLSADAIRCSELDFAALPLGIPLTGIRGLAIERAAWHDLQSGTVSLARAEMDARLSFTGASADFSMQGLSVPASLSPFPEARASAGNGHPRGNVSVDASFVADLGLPEKKKAGQIPWRAKNFSLSVKNGLTLTGKAEGSYSGGAGCGLTVTRLDAALEDRQVTMPRAFGGKAVCVDGRLLYWLIGEDVSPLW